MPSDLTVLAFDTSAAHCAAALLCGDQVQASACEEMTRGQAERLMPLLQDVLAEAGKTWSDLDAVAVGIGPGNFTGIRIAVSAARGLALGLDVPAIGVTGFEAATQGRALPAYVPAPRDQAYLLIPGAAPRQVPLPDAQAAGAVPPPAPLAAVGAIARIAADRLRAGGPIPRPAPLYIRPADAAPASDPPPVILDDA